MRDKETIVSKIPYMYRVVCFTLLLMCSLFFLPREVQAAITPSADTDGPTIKVDGSTYMTGSDPLYGKYSINYTGNTNLFGLFYTVEDKFTLYNYLESSPVDSKKSGMSDKITENNTETLTDGQITRRDNAREVLGVSKLSNSNSKKLTASEGANGTIAKAYLVWQTTTSVNRTKEEAQAVADSSIALIRPDGTAKKIKAKYAAVDERKVGTTPSQYSFVTMYADVTNFVQAGSSPYGTYWVCNLPYYSNTGGGESSSAWQLIVIEDNDDVPIRAVKLRMSANFNYTADGNFTNTSIETVIDMGDIKSKAYKAADKLPITGQYMYIVSDSSTSGKMTGSLLNGSDTKILGIDKSMGEGLFLDGTDLNVKKSSIRGSIDSFSLAKNKDNGAYSQSKFSLKLNTTDWATYFVAGFAIDIADHVVTGEQTTTVNSAASVIVSQTLSVSTLQDKTGYYDGELVITLDDSLTPKDTTPAFTVYNFDGENGTTTTPNGTWSSSKHTITLSGIKNLAKGSYVKCSIECTFDSSSAATGLTNSFQLSGYLCSQGTNTPALIPNLHSGTSKATPMYTLTVKSGTGISKVSAGSSNWQTATSTKDITYGTSVTAYAQVSDGYEFTQWTRTGKSATVTSGTSGTNQTATLTMPAGAVTLTANAKASTYTVKFNGNGATSGSMSDMTCKCATKYNLTANAFSKTGYQFKGWNTKADGTGTTYADKAGFTDLTTAGGTITLYAQWTPIKYTIEFNGNGATSGEMSAMTCEYDKEYALTANVYVKKGYTFTGWNTVADGSGASYQDQQKIKNLTSKNGDTITLYAQWTANTYTISFHPNDGAELTHIDDVTVSYDQKVTLPGILLQDGSDAYEKYTLDGVNITEQVISGAVVLDMYGNVIREGEPLPEGSKVFADGTITYPDGTILAPNGIVTSPDGIVTYPDGNIVYPDGAKIYPDGTVVSPDGIETSPDGIVTYPDGTVVYPDGTVVAPDGTVVEEDAAEPEEDAAEEKAPDVQEEELDAAPVASDATVEKREISRVTEPGEDVPDAEGETPETEPQPDKKAYKSVFMGWSLETEKDSFIPQWKAEEVDVSAIVNAAGLEAQNGATIVLYAVWDDCPWIQAKHLYYTLAQAQSGYITEAEILSHMTATDREDGSPIAPGFHENGTSFSIPDYAPTDFTSFRKAGAASENLTVVDSAGNTYRKQIMVYLVDTTPQVVKPIGYTRFINRKYYNEPFERGGLEPNSIWMTDPEYNRTLLEAFDNLENNTPEMVFVYDAETIDAMQQYVLDHGIGNSKEPDALQNFYDLFMAPNRKK